MIEIIKKLSKITKLLYIMYNIIRIVRKRVIIISIKLVLSIYIT